MDRKHLVYSSTPRCKRPKSSDTKKRHSLSPPSSSLATGISCGVKDIHNNLDQISSPSAMEKRKRRDSNGSKGLWKNLSNLFNKSSDEEKENIVLEKKKHTFRRLSSLFKFHKYSDETLKPVMNNGVLPKAVLKEPNDEGLAMAVTLPSGTPSDTVTITFEVDAASNSELQKNLINENSKAFECCEKTDSKTVFIGNLTVPSMTDLLQLSNMPLYIVNSKEKVKMNPGVEIKDKREISNKNPENLLSNFKYPTKIYSQQNTLHILNKDVDVGSNSDNIIKEIITFSSEVKPMTREVATQCDGLKTVNKGLDIQESLVFSILPRNKDDLYSSDVTFDLPERDNQHKKYRNLKPLGVEVEHLSGETFWPKSTSNSSTASTNTSEASYLTTALVVPNNSPYCNLTDSRDKPINLNQKHRTIDCSIKNNTFEAPAMKYENPEKKQQYMDYIFHLTEKRSSTKIISTESLENPYENNERTHNDFSNQKKGTESFEIFDQNGASNLFVPVTTLPREEIDKTLDLLENARNKLLTYVNYSDKIKKPGNNEMCGFRNNSIKKKISYEEEQKCDNYSTSYNAMESGSASNSSSSTLQGNVEAGRNHDYYYYYQMKPRAFGTDPEHYKKYYAGRESLNSIHNGKGKYKVNSFQFENREFFSNIRAPGDFLGVQYEENNHSLATVSSNDSNNEIDDIINTINVGLLREIEILENLSNDIIAMKLNENYTKEEKEIDLPRIKNDDLLVPNEELQKQSTEILESNINEVVEEILKEDESIVDATKNISCKNSNHVNLENNISEEDIKMEERIEQLIEQSIEAMFENVQYVNNQKLENCPTSSTNLLDLEDSKENNPQKEERDLCSEFNLIKSSEDSLKTLEEFCQFKDNNSQNSLETSNPSNETLKNLDMKEDTLKDERNKAYMIAQNDITNMIQELLKESKAIKETAVLNGVDEEKSPPFIYSTITTYNSEEFCRDVISDIIDRAIDEAIKQHHQIIDDQEEKRKEEEEYCFSSLNKKPSGDATTDIKVSESVADEESQKFDTITELGPVEHSGLFSNNQTVYFCSPAGMNKISSRIPKTSWSFGEHTVEHQNFPTVTIKNNSTTRKYLISKSDDRLIDSLEKCSGLFMHLFNELCCHSISKHTSNDEISNKNPGGGCKEGYCNTPNDNGNDKKSPIPEGSTSHSLQKSGKVFNIKPSETLPCRQKDKSETNQFRTSEEEQFLQDDSTIIYNTDQRKVSVKVSPISMQSSKYSQHTRSTYISSSSSSDDVVYNTSRCRPHKSLKITRSDSEELVLLKYQNPDNTVWKKTYLSENPPQASNLPTAASSGISFGAGLVSDTEYEADREAFTLPNPVYRYKSKHELNTEEEIAEIENNCKQNDILERKTCIVLSQPVESDLTIQSEVEYDDASDNLSDEI